MHGVVVLLHSATSFQKYSHVHANIYIDIFNGFSFNVAYLHTKYW